MINAPIRELPVNQWTSAWVQWFARVVLGLGGWRKTITKSAAIDFGAVSAQSELSSTVSVIGARTNDAITVTPSANTSGVIYSAVSTANDTVTIYAKNFTSGSINPASTTFHIVIFQD